MKTKLLRKLREKAKKGYWVEKSLGVYMVKSVNGTINAYSSFECAKEGCDILRCYYIETYIIEKRN